MEAFAVHPLTPDRWPDLLTLFGDNGAYSNCWCTFWVLGGDFDRRTPSERRRILNDMADRGDRPGLLAYRDGEPVGWVAVGPRDRYSRMASSRSRVYGPIDDTTGSWVVNCFYVPREHRRSGVASALLEAAVGFAFSGGAVVVDGYPTDTDEKTPGAAALFTGTLGMFRAAGFEEVTRGPTGRPVVRVARKG